MSNCYGVDDFSCFMRTQSFSAAWRALSMFSDCPSHV